MVISLVVWCWYGWIALHVTMVWVWGGCMKHNGVLPVGMQVYITCISLLWPSWLLYAAWKLKFQNGLFVAKMARSCLHRSINFIIVNVDQNQNERNPNIGNRADITRYVVDQ
jgi:hypothetical protein